MYYSITTNVSSLARAIFEPVVYLCTSMVCGREPDRPILLLSCTNSIYGYSVLIGLSGFKGLWVDSNYVRVETSVIECDHGTGVLCLLQTITVLCERGLYRSDTFCSTCLVSHSACNSCTCI